MKLLVTIAVFALAASALLSPPQARSEPPPTMMKVVIHSTLPSLPEDSFQRKAKTFFRIGSHFARTEELPDEHRGIHGLIITNQRDTWMINLYNRTGKHIVDRGPTFDVFMPLVMPDRRTGRGATLRRFEIGNEIPFLRERKADERQEVRNGQVYTVFSLEQEGFRIELLAAGSPLKPISVSALDGDDLVMAYEYEVYENDLSPDMGLFSAPSGLEITDVN
jgi:hypothetical protein